jgi:hypothetical protein
VRLEREQEYVGNDNDPGHFGEDGSNFGLQFSRGVLMLRPHRMNRIEDLAAVAKMSPFGFSPSIQKALISMTPLQYQNAAAAAQSTTGHVSDAANAETAAFEVGYEAHANSGVNTINSPRRTSE